MFRMSGSEFSSQKWHKSGKSDTSNLLKYLTGGLEGKALESREMALF